MIQTHTTIHVGPDEPRPVVDTATTLDGDLHLTIRLTTGDGSTISFYGPVNHVASVLAQTAVAAEKAQAQHLEQRRRLVRPAGWRVPPTAGPSLQRTVSEALR